MKKISNFFLLCFIGSPFLAFGQNSSTSSNQNVTPITSDTLSVHLNPFNPLMSFLPASNYAGEHSNMFYTNNGIAGDVAFFKPEVFVERAKPKFTEIKVKPNAVPKLNVLPINNEIIGYWDGKNTMGLDINQIAFVNWSAGGDNSISGLLKGEFKRNYTKGRLVWNNVLNVRYGVNKQSDREMRKTDDVLELNSSFGYKKSVFSDWYYVSKLNFKTQLTDGYNYPDINNPVSKWFAPAYMFIGVGGEYVAPKTGMKYYVSPLTYKATFVNDQNLADQGSFGVQGATYDENGVLLQHGKRYRAEVGMLISTEWKKEILKNIKLDTKLTLYSDYVDHFGNIDIMWELKIDMKVNDYVKANIGTNLIYDDNIKTKVMVDNVQISEGPKVQFKQVLGVGVTYTF